MAVDMLLNELPYGGRTQVLVNRGSVISKHARHGSSDGVTEPAIHDVACEATLGAADYRFGQELAADLAVDPFSDTSPNLQIGRQAFAIFDDVLVQKWYAQLQTMHHRELVGVHQKFIRKCRSDLEKLQAAQFVCTTNQI